MNRIKFATNLSRIEIDITYDCNLKCLNCNRSCTQAPSKEMMSFEQIKGFIDETINLNLKWEKINILGGEPTLHPDFLQIINLILEEYVYKHSLNTVLQITSNGLPSSKKILEQLPLSKNIKINKLSFKKHYIVEHFIPFNLAPIDNELFTNANFSNGCWITNSCGIGLNPYGYFCCAVAGGIERIFGLKKSIMHLSSITEFELNEQLSTYCRFCGSFSAYDSNKGAFIEDNDILPLNKAIISKTWVEKYAEYANNPKQLEKVYFKNFEL